MLKTTAFKSLLLLGSFVILVQSCASADEPSIPTHAVAYDLVPFEGSSGKEDGLVDRFDPEWLMSDLFFLNTSALSVAALQAFLEDPPYGERSWLADFFIDGDSAAQVIVKRAHESGINPLLLLTRMQVEQSLLSRSDKPSNRITDAALGCGCHDGESCSAQFKGLSKQLKCGGDALRELFDLSRQGEGLWNAGKSRLTLEGQWVRPANHATAAMYAYTPWVLRGRGGNWLAWNVMKKFTRFMSERGLLNEFSYEEIAQSAGLSEIRPDEYSAEELNTCLYNSGRAFVGDPCGCQRDCDFYAGSQRGFCHPAGFCSLTCEGGCPDVLNKAMTFCIEDPTLIDVGMCVPRASEHNGHCADLPSTIDDVRERFIGSSSSRASSAEVCAPR